MENKPDYRPDLIPQGTFKRNLAVFFVIALCFATFAVICWWWCIQTPSKEDISSPVTASNSVIESPPSFRTVQQCWDRYAPFIKHLEELQRQKSTESNRKALLQLKNDRWNCLRDLLNQ